MSEPRASERKGQDGVGVPAVEMPVARVSAATGRVIRVCIVDDDPFVTTSLATILTAQPDIQVEGEGHDGNEAVSLYERVRPDVLLMDIQMPGADGLAAAERILADHDDARIVFLTTFSDDEYIVRALRLGAKGYLIKQEVATIAPALRTVMMGQSVLGQEVLDRVDVLMSRQSAVSPRPVGESDFSAGEEAFAVLSEREHAVVELVAEGLDNKEIAATLYISEGTVRNHISVILQKLALKNRTQLAISYYRARGA
ncbi:MAG: response regulator transcription factor [Gordonibacter sp.]